MAGYMTKVVGADAIYEGGVRAGEDLHNGEFVEIAADSTVKKVTAAKDLILIVKEKEVLWGKNALRCDVLAQGSGGVYFVEKLFDDNGDEFDDANTVTKNGKYARIHMPLTGEELLFTVADELYASLNVGDKIAPATGGTVAPATGGTVAEQ